MAYEVFERKSVRIEIPALTIAPIADGRIGLNAAACRLFEKAGVKAVRILWDKSTCGVALLAAKKGDKDAYAIVFGSRSISAKAFLQHIGWSSDRRQVVPADWDEEQRMLEVKLPSSFVGTPEQKEPKKHKPSTDH